MPLDNDAFRRRLGDNELKKNHQQKQDGSYIERDILKYFSSDSPPGRQDEFDRMTNVNLDLRGKKGLLIATLLILQTSLTNAKTSTNGTEVGFCSNNPEDRGLKPLFFTTQTPAKIPSPIKVMEVYFNKKQGVKESIKLTHNGEKYYAKSHSGEAAKIGDETLRIVGLNKNVSPIIKIIAKIAPENAKDDVEIYSIGQMRKALPPEYKPLSVYFRDRIRTMEEQGLSREEAEDKISKYVINNNKIPLLKARLLGIDDLAENPENVFIDDKGNFAFPDTDVFSMPSLSPQDIEDFNITLEELQILKDFLQSQEYQSLKQLRLKFLQENCEESNPLYRKFLKEFENMERFFNECDFEKMVHIDEAIKILEKYTNEENFLQSQDISGFFIDKNGKIKIEFDGFEEREDEIKTLEIGKKHPFATGIYLSKEEILRKIDEKPQKLMKNTQKSQEF